MEARASREVENYMRSTALEGQVECKLKALVKSKEKLIESE